MKNCFQRKTERGFTVYLVKLISLALKMQINRKLCQFVDESGKVSHQIGTAYRENLTLPIFKCFCSFLNFSIDTLLCLKMGHSRPIFHYFRLFNTVDS